MGWMWFPGFVVSKNDLPAWYKQSVRKLRRGSTRKTLVVINGDEIKILKILLNLLKGVLFLV